MTEEQQKKGPLFKRMIIVIILLVIVFGGIFGWGFVRSYFMKQYFANFTPPPVTISTTKAQAINWEPSIPAVGSMVAINGVTVSPEIPGTISKIFFASGQLVKAGDPLIQIDDSLEQQELKGFQAQLRLDTINYQRQAALYKTQSAAAAALDQARANMQISASNVGKTEVTIIKKHIVAPFAGKVGIRLVNLGQYVAAGTPLVAVQQLDPLYAQFSLPEQYLKNLYVGQPVEVKIDARNGEVFTGKITAINSQIDADTRNILVQATLPNPQYKLYPGLFANVNVLLPQQNKVITLPQTAVNYSLYGDSVFLVVPGKDKQGKAILQAKLVYVTTGDRRGNEIAITKGLTGGEEVVTSGQLKLQDDVTVVVDNSVNTLNTNLQEQTSNGEPW